MRLSKSRNSSTFQKKKKKEEVISRVRILCSKLSGELVYFRDTGKHGSNHRIMFVTGKGLFTYYIMPEGGRRVYKIVT